MVTSFYHCNDVKERCRADVRLFVFLSFPRAGMGMRSHMGKNNGNPDLVCEKSTCTIVPYFA